MKVSSKSQREINQIKVGAGPESFEWIVHDQLVHHMEILMRFNAQKTSHDPNLINKHVRQRSIDAVNERLSATLSKLENLHGSSQSDL